MSSIRHNLAVTALLMAVGATVAFASSDPPDADTPTAMRCMKTEGGLYVCTAP